MIRLLIVLAVMIFGETHHAYGASNEINETTLENTLDSLDDAIQMKDQYTAEQTQKADSLKIRALHAKGQSRRDHYWALFDSYRRVQTDSALYYLNELEKGLREGESARDDTESARLIISRADIYGVCGMYSQSLELLSEIDTGCLPDSLKARYYHTLRTIYGWLTDYASTPSLQNQYGKLTSQYRDSILRYETPGVSRDIVLADKQLTEGRADEALALMLADISNSANENRRYIYTNIAEAYRQKGEQVKYLYYMALTAIDDIHSGVKEYMALPQLAEEMYEQGNITRAYRYLTCSMADAASCKARLRSVETSNIFPIIDRAYKMKEKGQRRTEHILTAVLVVATLLFGSLLYLLYRQNRKLGIFRLHLMDANKRLKRNNIELEANDKVKDEYIAFYLDKCRGYLEALKKYRQGLLKLAKGRQHDALLKQLNSSEPLEQELQRFYKDFDEAFLNIHPKFVERINNLLEPDNQLTIKRGELLSTELRIFALIRLGVTDTQTIAHFLDYSNATVYNYRSRVRNNSIYDKDEFERRVREL